MSLPLRQLASCWTRSCWEGKWADDICDVWNINASSWNKVRELAGAVTCELGDAGAYTVLRGTFCCWEALLDCRVIAPSDIKQYSIKRLEKNKVSGVCVCVVA